MDISRNNQFSHVKSNCLYEAKPNPVYSRQNIHNITQKRQTNNESRKNITPVSINASNLRRSIHNPIQPRQIDAKLKVIDSYKPRNGINQCRQLSSTPITEISKRTLSSQPKFRSIQIAKSSVIFHPVRPNFAVSEKNEI